MIEMLIALMVISVGLMSAMAIVYSNLALVDRDTDEVVAVNMAREGVELAKEVRDSNWLAGADFDTGLYAVGDSTNYTGTSAWIGQAGTVPSFDFTANAITDAGARVFLINGGTFYGQGTSGTSTPYARLITFHPICDSGAITVLDPPNTCAAGTKKGVRVESKVQWTRKGIAKSVTVYDDLYDWR